jgi:hypothetical protein
MINSLYRSKSVTRMDTHRHPDSQEDPSKKLSIDTYRQKKCKESSISKLSVDMNHKLSNIVNHPAISGVISDYPSTKLSFIDVNLHYNSIISKIQEITERSKVYYLDNVKQGELYQYKLNKHEKLFVSVYVKGYLSPLKVKIQKTGKVTVYYSSKFSTPTEQNHEKVYNCDKFLISDVNYRFNMSEIYLGIVAENDTKFKILFECNQSKKIPYKSHTLSDLKSNISKQIQEIQNNPTIKEQFYNRVGKILEKRKKFNSYLSNNKDYLRINMDIRNNTKDLDYIRSKSEQRVKKTQEVLEKKKFHYQEKITKAKNIIIRQEFKKQMALQKEIYLIAKKKEAELTKKWLKIISFFVTADTLHNKFKKLKENKQKSQHSAKKIQKIYKRWSTSNFDAMSKEILHARNSLLGFYLFTSPLMPYNEENFIQAISKRVSELKPKIMVKSFFKKILLIQKTFKERIKIQTFLIGKSIKLWKTKVSAMIKKFMNYKYSSKKVAGLVRIKDSERDAIIKDFLKLKMKNRRVSWSKISFYLPSKVELTSLIKLAWDR